MPILRSLASAIVCVAYLGAAFVPCEPSLIFVDWSARDAMHAESPAPLVAGSSAGPHASHSHAPVERASGTSRSELAGHDHSGMTHHAASIEPAAAEPRPHSTQERLDSTEPSHAGVAPSGLVLKPKCVCGCDETRSTAGGSASRLGATVPGAHLSRFVEAASTAPLDLVVARARERHAQPDPIPI